jgi:hypothetical protein
MPHKIDKLLKNYLFIFYLKKKGKKKVGKKICHPHFGRGVVGATLIANQGGGQITTKTKMKMTKTTLSASGVA